MHVQTDFHGTTGPIHVQEVHSPIGETFIKAGQELGFKQVDYNGYDSAGDISQET